MGLDMTITNVLILSLQCGDIATASLFESILLFCHKMSYLHSIDTDVLCNFSKVFPTL